MTQPIDREDLDALIRYHQDTISSHLHHLDPSVIVLVETTIKALKHFRDLITVIDNRQPEPGHLSSGPTLPPQEAAALPEKSK